MTILWKFSKFKAFTSSSNTICALLLSYSEETKMASPQATIKLSTTYMTDSARSLNVTEVTIRSIFNLVQIEEVFCFSFLLFAEKVLFMRC